MIHTSRSKIVSRFACPRQRYLRYQYGGHGLQRVGDPTGLGGAANSGLAIHEGNALVLTGTPVDMAVATVLKDYSKGWNMGLPQAGQVKLEQEYLIEGSIRAFARVRVPQLRAEGDIVVVEGEHAVKLTDEIIYDWRPDVAIRNEMGLKVVDWKPSPDGSPIWVRSWERNHQVFAYVWAAQQVFPDDNVLGIKIEGYVKGRRRYDPKFGRKLQGSPLCYVYENEFTGQITPDYQRSSGWAKIPLWETTMSSKEYVEEFMTKEQVEHYFLAPVPEICPTPEQIKHWYRQTVSGETWTEKDAQQVELIRDKEEYEEFMGAMDDYFPQNFDTCYKYGEDYPCEFDGLCFNDMVQQDPIGSGLYEPRVDHHASDEEE